MRLMPRIRVKCSSGIGEPSRPTTLAGAPTPAQQTSTRSSPTPAAVSTAASTAAVSVTSAGTKRAPLGRPAAVSAPALEGRSTMTTVAPAVARRRAEAAPSPEAPPVTSATEPVTSTTAALPEMES